MKTKQYNIEIKEIMIKKWCHRSILWVTWNVLKKRLIEAKKTWKEKLELLFVRWETLKLIRESGVGESTSSVEVFLKSLN